MKLETLGKLLLLLNLLPNNCMKCDQFLQRDSNGAMVQLRRNNTEAIVTYVLHDVAKFAVDCLNGENGQILVIYDLLKLYSFWSKIQ